MKCSKIMTSDPAMCVPEDNVDTPIKLMWECDCGVVPVVKDLESKELVGIVTDRDIAMYVVGHTGMHPSRVKVGDYMSSPVVSCQTEESLVTAIQLMGEHQIRRIPVVDENGCCVGIISQADLLLRAVHMTHAEPIFAALQKISVPER